MTTRGDWSSYKLQDGLNIWGSPTFKGSPNLAVGLTQAEMALGDAVTDTLVLNGRIATGSIAGSELDIDATYAYSQLIELRLSITDWTGVGGSFTGMYSRFMVEVDSATKTLRGSELYLANADNIDLQYMLGTYVCLMGKGNSAITLMRGAEIKMEWLASDVITDAVGLRISYTGLAAPTNVVYGLEFESASSAGAMATKFYEIKMDAGMCVLSGGGAPGMTAPKGSLYLRTDGSGTTDRAYINTDAGTTWTAITTSA